MNKKLFTKLILSQILDAIIVWGGGALIISGILLLKSLKIEYTLKFSLGGFLALVWIFDYCILFPYKYFNGQTLMKKLFKVGIKLNVPMKFVNLFAINTVIAIILPIILFTSLFGTLTSRFPSLGIYAWLVALVGPIALYLVNFYFAFFSKKQKTLEQLAINFAYYDTKLEEYTNFTKDTKIENKKKIQHKKKKKRR